jgi:hypothetical protein
VDLPAPPRAVQPGGDLSRKLKTAAIRRTDRGPVCRSGRSPRQDDPWVGVLRQDLAGRRGHPDRRRHRASPELDHETDLSGEYQYHRIIARSDLRDNEHWNEVAQDPYLGVDNPGSAEDLFLPYENARSIKEKVGYAASERLGGVMIWELRGDYLPDGQHPLVTALKQEYQAQYGRLPGDLSGDSGGPTPVPDPDPVPDSDPVPDPAPTPDPDPVSWSAMHVGDLDNSLTVNGSTKW